MMNRREIRKLLSENSLYYGKLTPTLQRKFFATVIQLLHKNKIIISFNSANSNELKVKIAANCALFLFASFDRENVNLFDKVIAYESDLHAKIGELEKKLIIPVRIVNDDFDNTIVHDFAAGYYRCYLLSTVSMPVFSNYVGQVEMQMIDRFEFGNLETALPCSKAVEHTPVEMFACINSFFFNNPEHLQQLEPELFDSLSRLWNFHPLELKIYHHHKQLKQVVMHEKKRSAMGLHSVYYYALVSFFIGMFALLYLFDRTLIPFYVLLLLVLLFTVVGMMFIPVFRRRGIPLLKIPFAFFSIFGVGVNFTVLLLFINFMIPQSNTDKKIVLPYKQVSLIGIHPTGETSKQEYSVHIKFGKGIGKRMTFEIELNKEVRFLVVSLHKGVLGWYVISDQTVLYN